MSDIAKSYEYCEQVAKTQAKNFYYSFLLLPRQKRRSMCAIYAFMRYCDDLSDDESSSELWVRAAKMERWRNDLKQALSGVFSDHPVWPAFVDTVQRYRIPEQYFFDMIDGVSSDLDPKPFETFEDLYRYCYRVASVVGLTIVHIFGFDGKIALELAEKCGVAFQLTNILRDVREDAERGRLYLPKEDLAKFGLTSLDPKAANFRRLLEFEAQRALQYYRDSTALVGLVHRGSRSSLWAMIEIYRRLLDRIMRSNYAVWDERQRLSTWEKLGILVEAKVKFVLN
jgi:15-cis-phytoene synthase